jgi:transglutaminase-like putative cysteine protease
MILHVRHATKFNYSAPVSCDPLVVRLRPREDASQRLHSFLMTVDPPAAGTSDWLDVDGNAATCLWFAGPLPALEIRTSATVETRRTNPYDFLLFAAARHIPPLYAPAERSLAAHFAEPTDVSAPIASFARDTQLAADGQTTVFLSELCARIHGQCRTEIRPSGDPWPAERTLSLGRGACRDLAVLFNEACRAVGLPARFVSGYGYALDAKEEHELHAWSEVFLPGGGWRGYDPSIGLAVSDHHVPLAASRWPQGAAPTTGTFSGMGVRAEMTSLVEIAPGDQWQAQSAGRSAVGPDKPLPA